jgi:hypothetical protein
MRHAFLHLLARLRRRCPDCGHRLQWWADDPGSKFCLQCEITKKPA